MKQAFERETPRCPGCGSDNLRLICRYSDPRTDRPVRLFKCQCGDDFRDEQVLA
ncbi:hypothetical protein JQ625_07955 [Bradyrhizobium diazoefficiens]|nr:hypothetical protein [Bradyrhizobium diazoefficiens]MBR0774760.1 hypothetical protein [Bradyrhizobium diazoefficiens]